MSRASEITLILIFLQASIGFVDGIGLFDNSYMGTVSNNASYTITDLEEYTKTQDITIWDEIYMASYWLIESFIIGIKIVFTVVFVFPTLVSTFQVPTVLSVFLQAGIYYVYALWFAQFRSGKGYKQYE